MKSVIKILIVLIAFSSCQKVIDVDLNDANKQVVLVAKYTAEDSTVRVRITETSSYFNSEASPEVNDAVVTITNQNGVSQSVPFVSNGNYELAAYVPEFGTTYTITVLTGGKTFTASSYLPPVVPLSVPEQYYLSSFFGGDSGYVPELVLDDPAGIENYYLLALTKNGEVWDDLVDLLSQDDRLTDGNTIMRPLFGRELYQIGDTAEIELRCVDKATFTYVNQAQSTIGQNSGAPANPDTNWDNGALGYFSAYSSSRNGIVFVE